MLDEIRLPSRVSPAGDGRSCALEEIGARVAHLRELALALLAEIGLLEEGGAIPRGCDCPPGERAACLPEQVRRLEVTLIRRALAVSGRNKAEAARRLGIKPNTLFYKMRLYGLCAGEGERRGDAPQGSGSSPPSPSSLAGGVSPGGRLSGGGSPFSGRRRSTEQSSSS